MKLKIAVCDDETSIINRLKQFLVCHELQYDDDLIVDYFQSGKELLEAHNNAQYDIIFLDIEMPHVNGLQTATKIRNRTYDNSFIVFVTNYPEYMHDSFSVQPFQYLMKPFFQENISKVIFEIKNKIRKSTSDSIMIDDGENERVLQLSDLEYIAVSQKAHILEFHVQNDIVCCRGSLKDYTKLLSEKGFVTPSRGYIINIRHVKLISQNTLTLKSGQCIPVSCRQMKLLKSKYTNYILELIS